MLHLSEFAVGVRGEGRVVSERHSPNHSAHHAIWVLGVCQMPVFPLDSQSAPATQRHPGQTKIREKFTAKTCLAQAKGLNYSKNSKHCLRLPVGNVR